MRTGERRYAIHIFRPGLPGLKMDPAPGFDPYIPHDLMHMVVEAELGLTRAVFGQLADGGMAGSFSLSPTESLSKRESARVRRQAKSRDATLLKGSAEESAMSERATLICWHEWLSRSKDKSQKHNANKMAADARHVRKTAPASELRSLNKEVVERICSHLDRLSSCWNGLEPGGKMRVRWPDLAIL